MQKIKIIVEKTGTGYSAHTEEYPVKAEGKDLKAIKNNIAEALNQHFLDKKMPLGNAELEFELPDEDNNSSSWEKAKQKLEKLKKKEEE